MVCEEMVNTGKFSVPIVSHVCPVNLIPTDILAHGCPSCADILPHLFFVYFSLGFYWDVPRLEGSFLSHGLSKVSPLKIFFGVFHIHVFLSVFSAFLSLCPCCLSIICMLSVLAISTLSISVITVSHPCQICLCPSCLLCLFRPCLLSFSLSSNFHPITGLEEQDCGK